MIVMTEFATIPHTLCKSYYKAIYAHVYKVQSMYICGRTHSFGSGKSNSALTMQFGVAK
jgi:hypothetical protein